MAKARSKSTSDRNVRVGDVVIWYPGGKVTLKNGVPAMVERLYTNSNKQVQLCRVGGPYEVYDNVWHASEADARPEVVTAEVKGRVGLWQTIEEHDDLYEEELDRIDENRVRQREEAKRREEDAANRREALAAVRSGKDVSEVAKKHGIDQHELAVALDQGI